MKAPPEVLRRNARAVGAERNLGDFEEYHGGSQLGGRESDAVALDEVVRQRYNSRLSRKRGNFIRIELFDNREWNQNVRGELVVARGLQGP